MQSDAFHNTEKNLRETKNILPLAFVGEVDVLIKLVWWYMPPKIVHIVAKWCKKRNKQLGA